MRSSTSIGALCALASTALAATPVVTIDGNAFFAGGERFYIRGVDYQPGGASDPVDPMADTTTCERDIAQFAKLGINTVRIYTVDNSANHDECMSVLADAGIYLALDVNSASYSINREDPAKSYNAVYLQNVFATIDAFEKYDNTLLFFSGNEVINAQDNTNTAPYVKAVTRDMKNYIAAQGYRHIPVGYSAADVTENVYTTAQYMNCGPDAMARGDFYAFNDYSWCSTSYTQSGWDQKVELYSNYSIPIFLSEFGCIKNPPRTFDEFGALMDTSEMTPVYSGGLVYQYTEESDNPGFGLVTVDSTTSVTPIVPDFANLQSALAEYPAPSGDGGYKTDGDYFTTCPPLSSDWQLSPFTAYTLPAFPAAAVKYMTNGAGEALGLDGPGSQQAGSDTIAQVTPSSVSGQGYASQTGGSSSDTDNAAPSVRPLELPVGIMVSTAVVLFSTFCGFALL